MKKSFSIQLAKWKEKERKKKGKWSYFFIIKNDGTHSINIKGQIQLWTEY